MGAIGPQGPAGPAGPQGPAGPGAPPIGFITITKNVIGDTRPVSDFTINIEGNNPSKPRIPGTTEGVDVIVGEGQFRVTEQPMNGYTTTYSQGCEGVITVNSQRESCTITNTAEPGSSRLIVRVVVNEEGCPFPFNCPNASPDDFTVFVNGRNTVPSSFPGSGAGTTVTLDPGFHSVNARPPAGWLGSTSFSSECSGTIFAGQTKSCTITNTGHIRP
jgi:hypothetical protein